MSDVPTPDQGELRMGGSVEGSHEGRAESGEGPPKHLWVVGVLALLWNAMGGFDYLATQMEWEFYVGQFTEEQLAYFLGFPAWAVSAWAVGVWGAVAGSVGLLLRRRWAVWMFGASLIGMALTTLYSLGLSAGASVMGTGAMAFTVVVAAVAIFLFIYSRRMAQRGVLA